MVNCSFCGIEIHRLVFCTPSHKTRYHRGDKKPKPKMDLAKEFHPVPK